MRSLKDISYSIGHSMLSFLTTWNALIFCFFCLLSTGIWYIHAFSKMADDNSGPHSQVANASVLTEKQINVPVQMRGVPGGKTAILFPASINVTASVNDEDYKHLSADDFSVSCTYPSEPSDHLTLEVRCLSKKVVQYHYAPETVEYIIQ